MAIINTSVFALLYCTGLVLLNIDSAFAQWNGRDIDEYDTPQDGRDVMQLEEMQRILEHENHSMFWPIWVVFYIILYLILTNGHK